LKRKSLRGPAFFIHVAAGHHFRIFKKTIRATAAKEVGMKNPAEKNGCPPESKSIRSLTEHSLEMPATDLN